MATGETILQFGTGRFLRAFLDLFVEQANPKSPGRIVVIQSTGGGGADQLAARNFLYHVAIRGVESGAIVDRVEEVGSISRTLTASRDWPAVLEVARSPELKFIVSNTTEAGFKIDSTDGPTSTPPNCFPGKLLSVLHERWMAAGKGLTILPCELIENNARILFGIVAELAKAWNLPPEFLTWMAEECAWCETLVDRIVSGTPAEHPLLAEDPLLIAAEPYALFAVEQKSNAERIVEHPKAVYTDDVKPYFLRKVRILNAAHTALLIRAVPRGIKLVREAVADAELRAWLERLLFEEIVPTLEGRVVDPAGFARETLDRFANPFLDHKFADISLHHASKVTIRLVTTRDEYLAKFGKPAPLLSELLADGGAIVGTP